jgi:hypothetical protein
MNTAYRNIESALEFEAFPGRADIQVSKVLTTAGGDKIRAIFTTDNSVMLAAVGDPNGDTVIVTGELPTDQVNFLGRIWDIVKKRAAEELLGGGGGQNCTTTTSTTVTVDDGKVVTMTMTTTKCGPA